MIALVPKWALAAALVACSLGAGALYVQRDSARGALAALEKAVIQQKADAAQELAAATSRVLDLERAAIESKRTQDEKDAAAQRTIQKQRDDLRAMSRAGGGPGLRDPNADSGGGCSCPGTAPESATGAGDRPVDAPKTGGVLSGPLEELLLRVVREADDINAAYASSRLDAQRVREVCVP